MPTKTSTLDDVAAPIDAAPAVAAILRELQPLQETRAALTAQVRDLNARLQDPWPTGMSFTPYQMDEARALLPQARQDLALAEMRVADVTARYQRARSEERERRRALFHEGDRAFAAKLEARLREAMRVNVEWRAWQQTKHELLGEYVERLFWHELNAEDGSRFAQWLVALRANGMKDD